MEINSLLELGMNHTSGTKAGQASTNTSNTKDNSFLRDIQRAVEKSEKQASRSVSPKRTANDAVKDALKDAAQDAAAANETEPTAENELFPQEGAKEASAQDKAEGSPEGKPHEVITDPSVLAAMAQLFSSAQPAVIDDTQAAAQALEGEGTPVAQVQDTPDTTDTQLLQGNTLGQQEEPAVPAENTAVKDTTAQDARFAERVLGEIKQAVESNEAERTVSAQPVAEPEQEAQETARPSEYDPNKKSGEEDKNAKGHDATPINTNTATAVRTGAPLEVALENGALAPRPAQNMFFEGVLEAVQTAVTEEQSELYVQLKPDVLGGLAIRLVMTDEGLSAQVRTSNAQLQTMVNAEIAQLEANLRDRGIQLVRMDVIYDQSASNQYLNERQGRQPGSQRQGGGHYFARGIEETGALSTYEQLYESMVPVEADHAEGVDYTA